MIADIVNAVIWLGAIAAFLVWFYRLGATRQFTSERMVPDDKTYAYIIGDDLRLYGRGATFKGMGVLLPKNFPQLYLDTQKGGGRRATYAIDHSQKISLEGDFDTFFQLYAPKGSQTLALSIMSPDVMQTVKDMAGNYDIELYRNQLHIISRKPVFHSKQRQTELLAIFDAIMPEIVQRMHSWKNLEPGTEPRLLLYPFGGVRLLGHFYSWQFVIFEFFWSLMTFVFLWMAVLLAFYYHQPREAWLMLGVALVLLLVLTWLSHVAVRRNRFHAYD